jgi:hypothetical protein
LGFKILKFIFYFIVAYPDSGSESGVVLTLGSGIQDGINPDPDARMNIPDPQHPIRQMQKEIPPSRKIERKAIASVLSNGSIGTFFSLAMRYN